MDNLKTFEEFGGGTSYHRPDMDKRFGVGGHNDQMGYRLVKDLDKITSPEKPFQRDLSPEERRKLFRYFKNFSWSNPDAKGRIILGGGEVEAGIYYITPEDLETLPDPGPNRNR